MFKNGNQVKKLFILASIAVLFTALPGTVWAHCDTESGPTAVDARKALETGDFKKAAIWVAEKQTAELRDSFVESLAVYKMGGKAKKLAERYFMSTTVRLHREAEGMSFTGLKPAQPLPPIIAIQNDSSRTSARCRRINTNKRMFNYGMNSGGKLVEAYVTYRNNIRIGRSGLGRRQGRARSVSIQDPHEYSECVNGKRIVPDPEDTEPQRDDTMRR